MSEPSSEPNLLDALLEEFADRRRRGEKPTIDEYAARHPELASQIHKLFPALGMLEEVRHHAGESTGPDDAPHDPVTGARLQRLGEFRLLRELGRGGMGIVYEAEQESLGRHVALKVLPTHTLLDPRRLQRFQREARAAGRLHHTNIVPVHGVGQHEGVHYYIMQFIPGLGLDQVLVELRRLRRGESPPSVDHTRDELSAADVARSLLSGPMPPAPAAQSDPTPVPATLPGSGDSLSAEPGRAFWQSVARVGIQVAQALGYAAAQGILHRDVKPSNLLLDASGVVWVTDFGLAKAADSDDLTHTGDVVGTVRYMAPERFNGVCDLRSDLYSLGLTLYELITLRPAYTERDRQQLLARVLTGDPIRPSKLVTGLPLDLEMIVLKAMAHEPEQRYQTAEGLIEDLQRFLDDRPPRQARRAGRLEQFGRLCRRNPVIAGLTGSLILLLVVTAAVAWITAYNFKTLAANEAEAAKTAREAQHRAEELVANQFVENGMRHLEDGDRAGAALWFAHALEVEANHPERADLHRMRVAATLGRVPRPARLYAMPARVDSMQLLGDGSRFVVSCSDWTVRVYETATGKPVGKPLKHQGTPRVIHVAADGRRIVSRTDNQQMPGRMYVWDAPFDRPAREFATGSFPHLAPLYAAGRVALVAEDGSRIEVRDASTGVRIGAGVRFTRQIAGFAFRPDGRYLAVVLGEFGRADSAQARVLVGYDLDRERLTQEHALPERPTAQGGRFGTPPPVFSPDGRQVALVGEDGSACTIDVTTGKRGSSLGDDRDRMQRIRFAGTGLILLTGMPGRSETLASFRQSNGFLSVHDTRSDKVLVSRLETPMEYSTWPAQLSPDNRRLLYPGDRGQVCIRNLYGPSQTIKGPTPFAPVISAAWSPDGMYIAAGAMDGSVSVLDSSGEILGSKLSHESLVSGMAFTPDCLSLLVAAGSGVRLWSLANIEVRPRSIGEGVGWTSTLLSPDGSLVIGHRGRQWQGFRTADGSPLGSQPVSVNGTSQVLGMTETGRCVALYTFGRQTRQIVQLWYPESGELHDLPNSRRVMFLRGGRKVVVFEFESSAPEEVGLAAVASPFRVRMWDVEAKRFVSQPSVRGQQPYVLNEESVRGERDLLFLDEKQGRELCLLDLETGKTKGPRITLPDKAPLAAATFLPGGRRIMTVSMDMGDGRVWVRCWDASDGQPVARPIELADCAQGQLRHSVHLSADGDRMVSLHGGQGAGFALVWNVVTGERLGEALRHEGRVLTAGFSPDGTMVATGAADGVVRVWTVPQGAPRTPPLRHSGGVTAIGFDQTGRLLHVRAAAKSEPGGRGGLGFAEQTWTIWDARRGQVVLPPVFGRMGHPSLDTAHGLPRLPEGWASDGKRLVYINSGRLHIEAPGGTEADPAQLRQSAELAAARHITSTGGIYPLDSAQVQARWDAAAIPTAVIPVDQLHRDRLESLGYLGSAPSMLSRQPLDRRSRAFAARIHLDQLLAGSPPDRAVLRSQRGEALILLGDPGRALPDVEAALAAGLPEARWQRARLRAMLGQWDGAAQDIRATIEQRPAPNRISHSARHFLMLVEWKRGQAEEWDRQRKVILSSPAGFGPGWSGRGRGIAFIWACFLRPLPADEQATLRKRFVVPPTESSGPLPPIPFPEAYLLRMGEKEQAWKLLESRSLNERNMRAADWLFLALARHAAAPDAARGKLVDDALDHAGRPRSATQDDLEADGNAWEHRVAEDILWKEVEQVTGRKRKP